MLILSLAEQSAGLIFFLGRDMRQIKNKTKTMQYIFNIIVAVILYLASVAVLAILLAVLIGHMFLINACTF